MENTPPPRKAILIDSELHKAIKVFCAERGIKIAETVEGFIADGIEKKRLEKAD